MSVQKKLGEVITFYSYKGGVGRSRALANVAYLLAKKHLENNSKPLKILCIDFDLEAPGLHKYFQNSNNRPFHPIQQYGLLDLLYDYKNSLLLNSPFPQPPRWQEAIVTYEFREKVTDNKPFYIDFLGPGQQTRSYGRHLAEFDWNNFYDKLDGGNFLETLRGELRETYDYVLVDSRTGESDIGGICTIQLPTILTMVFTSSPQSTIGIEKIILSIQSQYRMIRNGAELPIIPLPSKIDRTVEDESYRKWFKELIESKLGVLMAELVGVKEITNKFNQIMTLYFPWYTFHDTLEVVRENINETAANASRYNNFVSLITQIQDITIRRDEEVNVVGGSSIGAGLGTALSTSIISSYATRYLISELDNQKNQINDDFLNNINIVLDTHLSKINNLNFLEETKLIERKTDIPFDDFVDRPMKQDSTYKN